MSRGPWARAVGCLTPEVSDTLQVTELRVDPSLITARVGDCRVTLSAPTIPPRIWAAMAGYARGRGALERAVAGEEQLEHLASLMEQDWEEPLVPPRGAVVRLCSCDEGGECEHVAAVVRAVADAIDDDPAVLLRWRGVLGDGAAETVDPWRGGDLPELPTAPRRPPESVPNRFGASGIRVGDEDLVEVLVRAYAVWKR